MPKSMSSSLLKCVVKWEYCQLDSFIAVISNRSSCPITSVALSDQVQL